jgi:hypothetical protein
MKKSIVMIFGLLLVLSLAFFGCNNNVGPDGDGGGDGGGTSEPVESLSFNLTGAKALAAGEDASRKADAEDAFQMVKVLEDGSIEPVMELGEGMDNMWFPDVMFIAKSPVTDDVFVAFEWEIRYWVDGYEDPDTGEWVEGYDQNLGSFLHIKADGNAYPVVHDADGDPEEGRVRNNSWWGAEDYKPIDFDNFGNLFFVWESWSSSGSVNVMYKYDPDTRETTLLTPNIEGFEFEQFQVDPTGSYLFLKGNFYSGTGNPSAFMRMYSLADVDTYANVYFSSNSDVWVRGFEVNPNGDYMVLNGYNVRGMNGILKADIIDASTLEYTPMYKSDDGQGDWFDPIYWEWEDWQGEKQHNGFFDEVYYYDIRVTVLTAEDEFLYVPLYTLVEQSTMDVIYYSYYDYTMGTTIEYTLNMGDDAWFVTDAGDPDNGIEPTTAEEITWDTFEASETGEPLYKLSVWGWNVETGDNEYVYKDIPQVVIDYIKGLGGSYPGENIYMWDEYWYVDSDPSTGQLDHEKIMQYIGSYYITDLEFVWGELTGTDAFAAAEAAQPYTTSDLWGESSDQWHFMKTHIMDAETGEPAQTFQEYKDSKNVDWLNFSDIGNLFFDKLGQLWGVLSNSWWGDGGTGSPKPIKLLDSQGNRDLEIIDAFSGDEYYPVGFVMKGNHLYFRDAVLDADGIETGKHKLYRFDITSETIVVEDCLTNVENNGNLMILDFSINDDGTFMYFTAVSGTTDVVGGKVDLNNGFTYTEFDSALRLSNIEVY